MAAFRSREQALAILTVGGSMIAIGGGIFVIEVLRGYLDAMAFSSLLLLPPGAFLLRCARAGVFVEGNGIRVLNPFKSIRLSWAEVERFYVGQRGFFPRIGIVELRDGRKVAIFGIQGPNPDIRARNRDAENLIDRLNVLHRQATGASY